MIRRIEKVAVIGSGIMGGGIAALCASAGVSTILMDIVPFDLKDDEKDDVHARNRIVEAGLQGALKSKPALFMDKKNDVNLIQTGNLTDDFQLLADCDLIVEVIVEDLKIKQDLFSKIEKVMKKGAIIASNTSGLPLEAMAEGRSEEFKKNFLIMHFFNPVRYTKLLEFVAGPNTDKAMCDFIGTWGEKILGKGIVWAKDTPNFIANRIGVGLIGEAFQLLLTEDITIPEFDQTYGPAMGMPGTNIFGLSDFVGLDTLGHLFDNSYDFLPDDERRDIYRQPELLKKMIEKGQFGNKTKETGGFYKKEVDSKTWKKIFKVLDVKTGEHVEYDKNNKPDLVKELKKFPTLAEKQNHVLYGDDKLSKICWKLAARSLCYAANRIPEIADTIITIDDAMKWGYGLEAGPFESWDNIGIKKSVEKMKSDGIDIPDNVSRMLKSGNETFYRVHEGKKQYFDFDSLSYKDIVYSGSMIYLSNLRAANKVVKGNKSASIIDIGDGVFCLEFHTKMNALNGEIKDFMFESSEYVLNNGVGLVIGSQAPGMRGSFSAGGDLGYMGELAKAGKFSEIESFIEETQEAVLGAKYAPYPVVAAPYGMTFGGGCETCLAADKIVAHSELYMGLVEIGAGLLPAGGGCTNLWRKMIESVPKSVKLVDYGAFFIPTIMTIVQAKVSMSAAEARNTGYLGPKDRIVFNKDCLIGEAKKDVLKMVDDGYAPPAKTKIPVMGKEAQGMIDAEMFNMASGGYIPPHMELIAKKIAYVISGGEARQGQLVSEDYMLKLEREAFVELWKSENSQKMAANILATGKPLMM